MANDKVWLYSVILLSPNDLSYHQFESAAEDTIKMSLDALEHRLAAQGALQRLKDVYDESRKPSSPQVEEIRARLRRSIHE